MTNGYRQDFAYISNTPSARTLAKIHNLKLSAYGHPHYAKFWLIKSRDIFAIDFITPRYAYDLGFDVWFFKEDDEGHIRNFRCSPTGPW